MTHGSPVPLVAAQAAIALVLLYEVVLLARFLSWKRDQPRPREGRNLVLQALVLAAVFALAAGQVARTGALAPGVSGAGMPWEHVTDDTPIAAAAQAGQRAYLNRCAPCHLPSGLGLPPAYPPLVGSVFLSSTKEAHAMVALWGSDALGRQVRPAGRARMPAFAGAASDAELAAILTYERVAFDLNRRREGAGDVDPDSARHHVRPSDVAKARAQGPPQ